MSLRAFIELKFPSLLKPTPETVLPASKGRNGHVHTVGVEIWTNPHDNVVKVSPITSKGFVSEAAHLGLPYEKKALLALSAAFAELAETAPEHN